MASHWVTAYTSQDAENKYREWDLNPDLPLVCTIPAEDIAFAERLSRITGRRLSILTDAKNEYSIRGRIINDDGSWGAITTTRFHFGGEEDQVRNRAFIWDNPLTQRRPHGVHEIPEGHNGTLYRNSFGLIHPIGNVWARSIEGVVRGGAYSSAAAGVDSSLYRSFADDLQDDIGSRLAEEIQ